MSERPPRYEEPRYKDSTTYRSAGVGGAWRSGLRRRVREVDSSSFKNCGVAFNQFYFLPRRFLVPASDYGCEKSKVTDVDSDSMVLL